MLLDWRRHVAVNWMEEYRVISRRPRGYVDWLRATLIWRTDTVNRNPCSSLPQALSPPPLPTWSILILVSRFLLPLSFVWSLFAYFWRAKSCGTNFALWLYYCVNNGSQRAVRGGHRDRSWCLGESLICQLSLNELALAALSSSCMHNKWHSRVLSCRLKARGSSCYLIRRGLLMKGLSFLPLWNLFAAVELVQQTESSILQHKKKVPGDAICFLFSFPIHLMTLHSIADSRVWSLQMGLAYLGTVTARFPRNGTSLFPFFGRIPTDTHAGHFFSLFLDCDDVPIRLWWWEILELVFWFLFCSSPSSWIS